MTTAQEGGKVVILMYRPHLPPGNSPGTHFCWRLSRPQGHCAIGKFMSMKNSNDTIWNRTSDLRICSTAPQPLFHRVREIALLIKGMCVCVILYTTFQEIFFLPINIWQLAPKTRRKWSNFTCKNLLLFSILTQIATVNKHSKIPHIKFRKSPCNSFWNAIWAPTCRWCLSFRRQKPQW